MAELIHVEVDGADELAEALRKFPDQVERYLQMAGREAAAEVLAVRGLQTYPPLTAANEPPTPYYVRGRGTETATGNLYNSEAYGTQWYVRPDGPDTVVGNRASYAPYLADMDLQAAHMAKIGWRKLAEVATDKEEVIQRIYQGWVDKLLDDLGLS